MKPKVSVILPVYNVEPYLRNCIQSIQAQTLRDMEIICVDDGSTDGSCSILKEFAVSDNRFILIGQENRGAGAARNKGLALAQGKYLSFLDSDDFFEPDMLKKAYTRAEKTSAQIVCFRSDRYYDVDGRYEATPWTLKREQLPPQKVFSAFEIRPNIYRSMLGWAWDKMFEHDFIKKEDLLFQEIKIHNDMYFVFSALVSAERITVLDDVFVHQRKRNGGSLSDEDIKSTALECVRDALLKTRRRLESTGRDKTYGRDFINYACSVLLYHMNTTNGAARKILYHSIQNEWFDLFGFDAHDAAFFYDKHEYIQLHEIKYFPYDYYLLLEELNH